MSQSSKVIIFLLRISLGWLMFYSGIAKVLNPEWSAAGYLQGAKIFPEFYHWLLQPGILSVANFINEWGLTLLGVSLILGIGVRISSLLGAVLMLLYYFAGLDFPYPNAHSYIVDEHIIYGLLLLFFAVIRAGRTWGLENIFPRLRNWIG